MKFKNTLILTAISMLSSSHAALILHWDLDDGVGATTAADASGNGYGGAVSSGTAPVFVAAGGISGGYATFDDSVSSQAIQTTSFPTIGSGSFTPFTISGWVRTTASANDTFAVLRFGANSTYYSSQVVSGQARLTARNTAADQLNSGITVNDGGWHHIAAVFSGEADRSIFVDGTLIASDNSSVPFFVPSGFSIGALDRSAASIVDGFNGDIDDIQLYDNALAAGDVSFLFSNPGTTVPEPSTAVLVVLALGLGMRRRR